MQERTVAFFGAGHVAAYHAYAIAALPSFYGESPPVRLIAVTSATSAARESFAARYGFQEALPLDAIAKRGDVDTVYILSPNAVHYEHLQLALSMPGVRRVYIEKPLCVTEEEREAIARDRPDGVRVRVGFQFLRSSVVREAHSQWSGGGLGAPVHFEIRYLHSGYLDPAYRAARGSRMRPAPEGGAMVDLGSHAFSLAVAFLGDGLEVAETIRTGTFEGGSDLCTIALCHDAASGAVGTVTASRVSAGSGELLEMDVRCARGGFRFSTENAETLEVFSESARESRLLRLAGDFAPHSTFPRPACVGGWLRSTIHANYLFLSDIDEPPSPDLDHGLTVQRLLHDATRRITTPRTRS